VIILKYMDIAMFQLCQPNGSLVGLFHVIYEIFMSIRVSVSKFVTSVSICPEVQFDLTAKQVMCVKISFDDSSFKIKKRLANQRH
jgi:hypothetical protein